MYKLQCTHALMFPRESKRKLARVNEDASTQWARGTATRDTVWTITDNKTRQDLTKMVPPYDVRLRTGHRYLYPAFSSIQEHRPRAVMSREFRPVRKESI